MTMTSSDFAPRNPLGRTSALLLAACLALAVAAQSTTQRLEAPVVAMRLSDYWKPAAPPSASTVYAREDAMGPRTLLDRWNPVVRAAAQKFHVPAVWLRAVMRNETGGRTVQPGDKPITSSAGAKGVMQLMPDTYDQMAARHNLGADPFDPRDNVYAAAAYLSWLKDRYGFPGMFAAYNFGPKNWELYRQRKRSLPAETRNYVRQITAYLKVAPPGIVNAVHLTQPDGKAVALDTGQITAIVRAPAAQYAPSARTVIFLGKKRQAVREDIAMVTHRLKIQGVAL